MSILQEIQDARVQLIQEVNATFDYLLSKIGDVEETSDNEVPEAIYESMFSLSINPSVFKGKKPTGIILGDGN